MAKLAVALDFMENLYENYKLYGPYTGKDNRQRCVLVNKSNKKDKKTISYPKYIVETSINRYLTEEETIHHIDGNPLNNDLNNLAVITRSAHSKLDSQRRKSVNVSCLECKKLFTIDGSKIRYREIGKAGPFCSRNCSGKYGKKVQLGHKKLNSTNYLKIYAKEPYRGNSISEELNIGEPLTVKADGNTEA